MARVYCARAVAPSSTANLGSGFDVLAVAHNLYHDTVTVCVEEQPTAGVLATVEHVGGPYAAASGGAATARAAVEALLRRLGLRGVRAWISVLKGVPPGLGLGSSGASAAAAVVAACEALRAAGLAGDCSPSLMVSCAGEGEAEAAGEPHYDNVAASLLGWLTVVAKTGYGLVARSYRPRRTIHLAFAIPREPGLEGKTRAMRGLVPRAVSIGDAAAYAGRAALLALALAEGELEEAGRLMMSDTLVEPARSRTLPCYRRVVEAALEAGAYGASLSGAGPTMVALCPSRSAAEEAAERMAEAYTAGGCGPARASVAVVSAGAELLSRWAE